MKPLRVGIIGAGLIGHKRAKAFRPEDKLAWVVDMSLERASKLASEFHADSGTDWRAYLASDVDAVVIATTNDSLSELSQAFLKAGKHVLVEKPAGRNPTEVAQLVEVAAEAEKKGTHLCVGFNHRFHPGLARMRETFQSGQVGDLMYIRARYGHGGRLGYDREWRADPKIAGGGELLDQGVHLIDLCRWIGGEFKFEAGTVGTFFWDMPVEDNGFLLLKNPQGPQRAWLHASCSEWKNLFDFELFGRTGKLQVWGLGRSYGVEEFRHYQMKPEMGPPEIITQNYPGEDHSWNLEWEAFRAEIAGEKSAIGKATDALAAIEIVYAAYRENL